MKKPIKHAAAGVFIFTDSAPVKTLLIHHKKFDKWMYPGGHQEGDENPLETAIREAEEETGLDVSPYIGQVGPLTADASFIPIPRYLLEERIPKHHDEPEHFHIDSIYTVRIPESLLQHKQREGRPLGWYDITQLDGLPMLENVRTLLKQEMSQL
ncbi:MAG: hypothetical protein K0S68_982 [Candidatus Saccharibacteria bacterium]|jgi:8-oxo-dGTP pyrophosphatase MutT (NUDIX family)|nr:hypothetical protein [Candidatus Saccharibacteria bacterium]